MAINTFLGTAPEVVQVDTCTPASVGIGDVFTLTTSGYDGTSNEIEYTAVDTSAATVSGALINLWNNSTDSLQTGITASGTATVILTADVAGTGFKVASSASGGSATFTRAATTANGGPNDWADPANWSLGTIPGDTAGEDVYLKESPVSILYGLDQSGISNVLDSLHINQSYLGTIGYDGVVGEIGDYLQIETDTLFVGENFFTTSASGSGRLKIDLGTNACDIIVYDTGSSLSNTRPSLRLLADNALTIIREIRKGSVGIAFTEGETSIIGTALQSYKTSINTDSSVTYGQGLTITSLDVIGGVAILLGSITTLTSEAGTTVIAGEGTITTLTTNGGTVTPAASGTITTCICNGGITDFTQSAEPRTVTTLKVADGATLKIDQYDGVKGVVTVTNNIEPVEAGRLLYRISKG